MPVKIYILAFMLVLFSVAIVGCQQSDEDVAVNKEQIKSVAVMTAAAGENPTALNYIGTIDVQEIVKYSFKMPGQIKKIYVSEGDYVSLGDSLAELETTDLEFQLAAAKAAMDAASASVRKAREALDYIEVAHQRTDTLFQEGVVAQDALDQAQLKKDTAESDYLLAQSQLAAAETDYDHKADMLNSSTIYAQQAGYVAQKVFNENERVNAYTPVVVVRSQTQIVNIGIPQQELGQVQVGAAATVDVDDQITKGTVTHIAQIPDDATRTYKAEITMADENFRLGSIAKVAVHTGHQAGLWIPMSCIFSYDGEDCVYVVQDRRAFKKTIQIQNTHEDQAMVTGIENGALLVVSGMKNLDDGTKVKVQEQPRGQEAEPKPNPAQE